MEDIQWSHAQEGEKEKGGKESGREKRDFGVISRD
jgi:hypothetical protein